MAKTLSTRLPLLSLGVEPCGVSHGPQPLFTLETAHMKKLLAVLVAGLFAAGAFAQQAPATAPAPAAPAAPMAAPAAAPAPVAKTHKAATTAKKKTHSTKKVAKKKTTKKVA
ncbi:hypothetical protein GmRootA79_02990 [Acidovorax sp. A79]